MTLIKSFIIAFGTYSRVPMPIVTIDKDQDRYTLAFFPVIGLFIAFLCGGLFVFCDSYNFSEWVAIFGFFLIPLIVTGGIHLDGFMDCMDAVSSYKPKEEKLAILSDPHIGAFSVIKVLEMLAVYIIACTFICDYQYKYMLLLPAGFVISRALSGFSVMTFDLAKDTGMCAYTRGRADKKCDIICFIEFLFVSFACIYCYGYVAALAVVVAIACLFYYKYKSLKDFGGITGDTAGCFLVMTELAWVVAIGFYCLVEAML